MPLCKKKKKNLAVNKMEEKVLMIYTCHTCQLLVGSARVDACKLVYSLLTITLFSCKEKNESQVDGNEEMQLYECVVPY